MSRASPYYQVLRRNEPRQQNFAHFTKKLGAEPRHLAEDIVRDKNWAGASLLFEALNNGAPADTVIDLIRRNPEACKTKDSSGARPIAVAMRQGAQLSVIEALMAELPKSTFKGDAAGKLLMVSVRCGHGSDGVVAFWVKRFPHAARFRGGRYKELPLQAALECKRSPACIGTLLGAYSDAARHQAAMTRTTTKKERTRMTVVVAVQRQLRPRRKAWRFRGTRGARTFEQEGQRRLETKGAPRTRGQQQRGGW
mmetsp:Transcript_1331/g.2581  ORF Transcript_1331/g.2581 Transcript_1331/m.2581 type:complete len:253 (-) Transcript_1331:48-806(-)